MSEERKRVRVLNKLTKIEVEYGPAPKGSKKRCGNCSMYRKGGYCTLVAGDIYRSDLCKKWDAKKK